MPGSSKKRSTGKRPVSLSSIKHAPDPLPSRRWEGDLNLLRRLVQRVTSVTHVEVRPFAETREPDELIVATISSDVESRDLAAPPRRDSDYWLWCVEAPEARRRLRMRFLEDLTAAAVYDPHYVCFNELAYPTPYSDDPDVEEFNRRISEIVVAKKLVLLGGSFHDPANHYNLCPIFEPGNPREATLHAKLTSAVSQDERIRVPSDRRLRIYRSASGVFSVFVCLDAFDPSLVLRVMLSNHPHSEVEKIQVIFVPSFNEGRSRGFVEACKDLSYATRAVVVYVNCRANEPRHQVYVAGTELTALGGGEIQQTVSPNVCIHRMSLETLRRLRHDVVNRYSELLDVLLRPKKPAFNWMIRID
jgi:hypothetical protein